MPSLKFSSLAVVCWLGGKNLKFGDAKLREVSFRRAAVSQAIALDSALGELDELTCLNLAWLRSRLFIYAAE